MILFRQPRCSIAVTYVYKVKVMGRHHETSQFAFSDKDNVSEREREDIVAEPPRPISSYGAARITIQPTDTIRAQYTKCRLCSSS
jgi:hypothetical protein